MISSPSESFIGNHSEVPFAFSDSARIDASDPVHTPAMVPPESPLPMRRQPTPLLMGPLRWSVWGILVQSSMNLVRRSRYSLGYERD